MVKFYIKKSVLSPEARCNAHPLYSETEIVFSCENCSIEDAVAKIEKHED